MTLEKKDEGSELPELLRSLIALQFGVSEELVSIQFAEEKLAKGIEDIREDANKEGVQMLTAEEIIRGAPRP